MADRSGLIVDFGGVLTSSVVETFGAFCASEGLEPARLRELLRSDPEARRAIEDFECGRVEEAVFERAFAAILGVPDEGLVDRIFAGLLPDDDMLAGVLAARRAGVKTAMLSNSWGGGRYDWARMGELFDGWVISGEVGMRKPEPRIYELAAEALGLEPQQCVFVDDFPHNLPPAEELGMATVLHTSAEETLPELERLLAVSLR